MKITTVEYSNLVSTGNFENMKIGATALVEDEETPESALEKLRDWVGGTLGEERKARTELTRLTEQIERLRWDLGEKERQLDREIAARKEQLRRMRAMWLQAVAFLASHGITSEATIPIPENLDGILNPPEGAPAADAPEPDDIPY